MIVKMVELARAIAKFIIDECEHLEVLFPEAQVHHIASKSIPTSIEGVKDSTSDIERIFIITTFRARDTAANRSLVQRINDDRRIYVSGTMIEGEPAARIAVAKWNVDVQMDLKVVCGVLKSLAY